MPTLTTDTLAEYHVPEAYWPAMLALLMNLDPKYRTEAEAPQALDAAARTARDIASAATYDGAARQAALLAVQYGLLPACELCGYPAPDGILCDREDCEAADKPCPVFARCYREDCCC